MYLAAVLRTRFAYDAALLNPVDDVSEWVKGQRLDATCVADW